MPPGFDFPTTPATGTVVTVPDGSLRVWDSTKWLAAPSAGGIVPPGGPFLPLAGGTLTGDLNIGTNTSSARLILNGPANNALRFLLWRSAGIARWSIGPDGAAESATVTALTSAIVPTGTNVLPVVTTAGVASGMQIGVTGLGSNAYAISAVGTAPVSVTTTATVASGSLVVPVSTTAGVSTAQAITGSAGLAGSTTVKRVGGTSGIVTTTTSGQADPAFLGNNLPVVSLAGIVPGMLAAATGIAADTFVTGTIVGAHQNAVSLSKDFTGIIPTGTTVTFSTAIVLSTPTTGSIVSGSTLTVSPTIIASQNTTGSIAAGTTLTMYPNTGNTLNLNTANDAGLPWLIPLQVSRSTGVVNFNEGMSVVTPYTQQPSGLHSVQPIFLTASNWAGSATSSDGTFFKFHRINILTDDMDVGDAGTIGLHLHHAYGGAHTTGGRVAQAIELYQTPGFTTTGGVGSGINSQRIALNLAVTAGENAGGTGPTSGQASGSLYALATYSRLLATGFQGYVTGATFYNELNGINLNIGAQAGTSVAVKHGVNIAQLSDDAVQGSVEDAAIQFGAQPGSSAGWKNFLALGNVQGKYPGDPNGALWGTYRSFDPAPMRQAYGLDWRDIAFSTAPIATPGFQVDGSGNVSSGALVITTIPGTTSIDAALVSVTNTTVVSSGTTTWTAGMSVYDASRNHWLCTATDATDGVSAGRITGISAVPIGPAYVTAFPPPNPVSVTDQSGHQTATLNLTWTAAPSALMLQPSGGATVFGGPVSVPGQIAVPAGGSIQAAHDALPATGGSILLAANTTYVLTAPVNITKPNVHISAPSWSTVVQRDPSNTGGASSNVLINFTGNNCILEGLTVDGNSVLHFGSFEIATSGANSLVRNLHFVNCQGSGHLALAGNNSRATGNTITGPGIAFGTQTGYGIWAINHQTVMVDHNVVSGTCIDGIAVDGDGSQVIGNRLFGCHTYTGQAGGQIVTYPIGSGGATGNGITVVGNTIGPGGSNFADGIEAGAANMLITGNTIDGVQGYGILVISGGCTITGNYLRNIAASAGIDGIEVLAAAVGDLVITGNRIADDRATPMMRAGIWINTSAADRYTIVGNTITGATQNAIVDQASGKSKVIAHNSGFDAVIPSVASAATITLFMNPLISLTGSTAVTAIDSTVGQATGRTITIIPTGNSSFVAGNNIANGVTATIGVPIFGVFDGTLWHFSTGFAGGTIAGATTFASSVTVGTSAAASNLLINGPAGAVRRIEFDTATSLRWRFSTNTEAEGGSNAGSNFDISAYSDTGAVVMDPVLRISRATGLSNFVGAVQFTGGAGCGTNVAASNTDVTKHLALYSSTNGFSLSAGRINYVAAGGIGHFFSVAGADRLGVTSTGMGFNGTAPVAKPSITGSRGGNAALADLLTKLAATGLIADTTTA
jgi:hypothetical protein